MLFRKLAVATCEFISSVATTDRRNCNLNRKTGLMGRADCYDQTRLGDDALMWIPDFGFDTSIFCKEHSKEGMRHSCLLNAAYLSTLQRWIEADM